MNKVDHYWLLNPEEQEQIMKHHETRPSLSPEAHRCGPAVVRVVGNSWSSSIKEAYHSAQDLIRLSKRYTPEKVEGAEGNLLPPRQ